MSSTNNILKHELWKNISIEKLPDFGEIERKINQINLLSKKNNINILENLCSRDSTEFIKQLDEVITSDKSNAKPINFDYKKKVLFINNPEQRRLNKDPKSNLFVINNKKETNNDKNNLNCKNLHSKNINSNFLFEDSDIIEEKIEKKKDYAFLNNHDLLSPLKGNFSLSLKYYNNQEFLTFLNRKFNKDISKVNWVLNDSKKLSLVKQEFTNVCEKKEYNDNNDNNINNNELIGVKRWFSSKNANRMKSSETNNCGNYYFN